MNKDWNSSTSDSGGKPMEIKRRKVVIDSENCPHTSAFDMCLLCGTSDNTLMDCTYENCPVKYITRPDPAEVERLVDVLIRIAKSWSTDEELNKAHSDLLKAIQS